MTTTQHFVNGVTVLSLSGDMIVAAVDTRGVTSLALDELTRGRRLFLLDLARVGKMDSAGLGDLLQAYVLIRRHGGTVALVHPPPRIRELLLVTRVFTAPDMFEDEQAAMTRLAGRAVASGHERR